MLSDQDSGTNPPASTTQFSDPNFDSFLSSDNFSAIEHPTTTQDEVKTEQDDTTNGNIRRFEQHTRRETQQQHNMSRPGLLLSDMQNQTEESELKAFRSALAADQASVPLFQLQEATGMARPCTPPASFNSCQFPMTPDTSPCTVGNVSRAIERSKTFDSTPSKSSLHSANLSNYVSTSEAMQRSLSYPDHKSSLEAELSRLFNNEPSRPASAGLAPPPSAFFPDFDALNVGFTTKCTDAYDSSNYSPMSSALTPLISSFESSPEMTGMALFGDMGGLPDLSLSSKVPASSSSQGSQYLSAYPSPPKENSHRRTHSTVTVDELDGTNEQTGITEEEITTYIVGPLEDSKYMCIHEGCNKLFGRKENIRSHVQTHLGDRQWRCNHCHKRFVRQHDLKRHAKIHTGQKPHQCPCGNGFARHDALTRHRQRNTCIGGFGVAEGIPQSPSKRGRPKKRRDMESRREKAAKTRERALERASASPASGSSIYSAPSPEVFFDDATTSGMRDTDKMVTIQSVESDEILEAVNALSPEMVEEYFREMSKGSSPFSEFGNENLFGVQENIFEMTPSYDPTSPWL